MVKLEREGDLEGAKAAHDLLAEAEMFVYWESVDKAQYDSLVGRIKKLVGVKIL